MNKKEESRLNALKTVPPGDGNFTAALESATEKVLVTALLFAVTSDHKTRYKAVAAEIKRRHRSRGDEKAAKAVPATIAAWNKTANSAQQQEAATGHQSVNARRAYSHLKRRLERRSDSEAEPNEIVGSLLDPDPTLETCYQTIAQASTWHLTAFLECAEELTELSDGQKAVIELVEKAVAQRNAINEASAKSIAVVNAGNSTDSATTVHLSCILFEEDLQMRAEETDWEFVDTLTDVLRGGGDLAPVVLFEDPESDEKIHLIGDGNHRYHAYREAGRATIPAIVKPGGMAAAFDYALGANADQNAKPRTRNDIRRAVEAAVMHRIFEAPKKDRWTQQRVADACKVNQSTVCRIYKEIKAERDQVKKPQSPSTKKSPEPVSSEAFWKAFRADVSGAIDSVRDTLKARVYLDGFGRYPETAAEELEGIAEMLKAEARQAVETAKAIRVGMASEKQK